MLNVKKYKIKFTLVCKLWCNISFWSDNVLIWKIPSILETVRSNSASETVILHSYSSVCLFLTYKCQIDSTHSLLPKMPGNTNTVIDNKTEWSKKCIELRASCTVASLVFALNSNISVNACRRECLLDNSNHFVWKEQLNCLGAPMKCLIWPLSTLRQAVYLPPSLQ